MVWVIISLIPLGFFALFFMVYKIKKVSLWAGFFFVCAMGSGGILLAIACLQAKSPILDVIILFFGFVALIVLLFGIYILITMLLLNARAVFKRERRRLANSLTLILALALLALTILSWVLNVMQLPLWAQCLRVGLTTIIFYYFLHILVFLVTLLLCNLTRPRKNQQYIIVLGSGLVNGEVPPLLAGRINRAITFYNKQLAKGAPPPKLVLTGGQGADEPLAEGLAMQQYAIAHGVAPQHTLVEDKAASTWQNMRFSKTIMEKDNGETPTRCIFATSNYHLLRAGIYARKAGLFINGIGAKTALYYLPNALLREYIAFWWMYRKRNIIICILIFVLSAGAVLGTAIMASKGLFG